MIPVSTGVRCAIYAGIVLMAVIMTAEHAAADVCVYKPPKVRRVCGVIVDQSGVPIPAVKVTVLKDGTAVKSGTTDESGEFDFDTIQSGKYELDATVLGFQHARYQLTVLKPTNSCKRALRIEMVIPSLRCGGEIRETKTSLRRNR
jgi:hypothetical protein